MTTRKPTVAASGMSVSRSNDTLTAKWSIPSSATKGTRKWASQRIRLMVSTDGGKTWWTKQVKDINDRTTKQTTLSLPKADFTPNAKPVLYSVKVTHNGHNSKGFGPEPKYPWTKTIGKPAAPETFEVEVDSDTGTITAKTKTVTQETSWSPGCKVGIEWVRTTPDGATSGNQWWNYSGAEEKTKSINEASWQSITDVSDYVKYDFKTYCKGMAGSGKDKAETIVFSLPELINIGGVTINEASDLAIVTFADRDRSDLHPVDTVQLQYQKTDGTPVEDDWDDVDGAVDDGECDGISTRASQFSTLDAGQSVWFRLKTTHYNMTRVGAAFQSPIRKDAASQTVTPSTLAVTSAEPVDGEEAIMVTCQFTDTSHNGTEISWSTSMTAWESTKTPESFQMPDATWAKAITGGTYSYGETVKVVGLSEGERYFFRARRYSTTDDSVTGWTALDVDPLTGMTKQSAVVGSTATGVALTMPAVAAYGEPMAISWTVGGERPQTAWQLVVNGSEVASGTDARNSYELPAELTMAETVKAHVRVSVGGDFIESEEVETAVVERPTVTLSSTQTITAKPHALTATCSLAGCLVDVRLVSCGVTAKTPSGIGHQYYGDVVWHETLTATGGADAMTIGGDVELVDGAQYVLTAYATDTENGLTGATATATWDGNDKMAVSWAHQALAPASCAIVTDADALTATITPTAPQGAADGDVWDAYRVTVNGVYEIARGIAFGEGVTDPFAPYGTVTSNDTDDDYQVYYRICTRTADGDMDWNDFGYNLVNKSMRIEWGDGAVELPYDLTMSDAYSKGFDGTKYLDGSVRGSWSDGAQLTASLGANVLKVGGEETHRALGALGRWAGECYVRTPAGHAYAADVQVSGLSWDASSGVVSCSLTATEIQSDGWRA